MASHGPTRHCRRTRRCGHGGNGRSRSRARIDEVLSHTGSNYRQCTGHREPDDICFEILCRPAHRRHRCQVGNPTPDTDQPCRARPSIGDAAQAGELAPNGGERRKLASLESVLKYHDRSTMEIKVVDLPYAGLAIHQRAFLLVSRLALRLLSAGELQAAVAHEIGHEYFWAEYEGTGAPPAAASRHTIELKCDGIAALTLLALGLDVSRLSSAMTKMIEFNRSIGVTTDETGYPTVRERDIFVRTLLKMESATLKKQRDPQLAVSRRIINRHHSAGDRGRTRSTRPGADLG